jgi:hypothetical protein
LIESSLLRLKILGHIRISRFYSNLHREPEVQENIIDIKSSSSSGGNAANLDKMPNITDASQVNYLLMSLFAEIKGADCGSSRFCP